MGKQPSEDKNPVQAFYEEKASVYNDLSSKLGLRDSVVLSMFPAGKSLRVLDYGCGSGRFLRVLSNLGHHVTGMDISQAAVQAVCDSGVPAVVGTADTLEGLKNLEGDNFDVITALDVLEHTFDPAAVIRHLFTRLSTNGCLLISVPNVGCILGRATLLAGRFPMNRDGLFDSGHIRWFTRSNLPDHLRAVGGCSLHGCTGTPIPSLSKFGLWRLEGIQVKLLAWLAKRWPSLWGYQLVFLLKPENTAK